MILGLIPARANSKGIKDKNKYPLYDISLIKYTINAALGSKIDSIVISSDSFDYLDGRCKFIKRPKELAQDDTPMMPVVKSVIESYERAFAQHIDAICLLQPTSPLRTAKDIDDAIQLYRGSNATCLYSGYYMGIKTDKPYDKHTSEKHFQRNGAIFITSRELIKQNKLWDETATKYEMPYSRSIDIDSYEDMMMAEALLKGGVLEWKF